MAKRCRNLVVVLGDQLNYDSVVFDDFDKQQDLFWMAEVPGESTHVWSHQARIVMFLSAMRHFRDKLIERGIPLDYRQLDDKENRGTLEEELKHAIEQHQPLQVLCVQPGEWRIAEMLARVVKSSDRELRVLPDTHFYCSPEEFTAHAEGRKQLRLEHFYREMRRKHSVLVDGSRPVGGSWNYDSENRKSFGKKGPAQHPAPRGFSSDEVTSEVIELVRQRFSSHPGSLDSFDWPLTSEQATEALQDFVEHRLSDFGRYQDAMWSEEAYLFHSRLSAALNLKLLNPREAVAAAVAAYEAGAAPLSSVEGFVRQILGWREYVRGIYWLYMPEYLERNELGAQEPLPEFYWNGRTEMNCLSQAIGQTLEFGYAHHIQRLMVTGLFSLLLGVDPKQVHEWYLAVYVDAVEWVELPNSLGMSQYADGGVMASKPYVATGKYIQRMSNYCEGCKFDPRESVGELACPFTTLYWDFLIRHRERLESNHRMGLQLRNLDRKSSANLDAIRTKAEELRESLRQGN